MNKGEKFEMFISQIMHKKFLPVIISSKMLRSMDLGQVDVAILKKILPSRSQSVLILIECKCTYYPTKKQILRLKRTQDYLSRVLGIETKFEVKFCQKD